MTYLIVENLRKSYGSFRAVDDLSISIPKGKVCALLGPSGCGKTTTLRCIAGLERADAGRIQVQGQTLFDAEKNIVIAPEERGLGMVFQSYALWPHKTVSENLALGLRIKGMSRGEMRERIDSMLELVGMAGTGSRYPASLSGGQQQRIALARALALQPKCILFDEPLSNLDLLLRERMRFEIRELLVKVGITAVYVTHDQTEAMVISDHIVVLNQGRIEREGEPAQVYTYPRNRFTAEFLGRTNIIALNREASDPESGFVASENGIRLRSADVARLAEPNEPLVIAFRPETVQVLDEDASRHDSLPATVMDAQFLGGTTQLVLDLGGMSVTAMLNGEQLRHPNERVNIRINPRHVLLLSDNVPN